MYFEKASDEIESRINNIAGDLEIIFGLQYYYMTIKNTKLNPDAFCPLFHASTIMTTLDDFK